MKNRIHIRKKLKKYDKTWEETCDLQQSKEENMEKSPTS